MIGESGAQYINSVPTWFSLLFFLKKVSSTVSWFQVSAFPMNFEPIFVGDEKVVGKSGSFGIVVSPSS